MLAVPNEHVPAVDPQAVAAVDLGAEHIEAGRGHAQESVEFQGVSGAALLAHAKVESPRQTAAE